MVARKLLIVSTIFISLCLLFVSRAFANDILVWPVKGEVIRQFAAGEHRGIDISANLGDPVVAAQDGVVYWVGKTPTGEPCISIDHPGSLTSTYLPVNTSLQKGQTVKAGEAIGVISSESDKSSDTSHLHFGVFDTASRDDKNYLNPCDFLARLGVPTESKCPQAGSQTQVESQAKAMVTVDAPKNSSGEVAIANPTPQPASEIVSPGPVVVATPSGQRFEKPASLVAPSVVPTIIVPKTVAGFGIPLKDHSKRTSLSQLVLATENNLITSLNKDNCDFVKLPRYLRITMPYIKLLSPVGSAILNFALLMLISGCVLLTSRVAAIIIRFYTPASA